MGRHESRARKVPDYFGIPFGDSRKSPDFWANWEYQFSLNIITRPIRGLDREPILGRDIFSGFSETDKAWRDIPF